MKLTADLVEKGRRLLGGKNLTKTRLAKLLDEVEEARLRKEAAPIQYNVDSGDGTARIHLLAQPVSLEKLPAPDDLPDDDEDADAIVGPIANALDVSGARQAEDQRVTILMAELAQMKAKIEDLEKPHSAEALKDAVVAGKMPVGKPEPGPVGYTGSAQLPRGVWFESPFGPKVEMKLCDCTECTPARLQHYWCPICKGGPYRYTDGLGGQRHHFAPGSTWGVAHVMCSVSCWERYDRSTARRPVPRVAAIDVAPRHPVVADQEAGAPPERPAVAATSD